MDRAGHRRENIKEKSRSDFYLEQNCNSSGHVVGDGATVSQSSRAEGETARGHRAGGRASVRGGRGSIPSEGLERTESVFRF